ncbi:hypothetical protein BDN72DRAFT_457328 [Pluteus cervinus]|uniref:Uncharacterized protein n=1 Tax=Pluteus cervinus TaxID=181527 RepID=A0ACD3B0U5_9AGAR|nr:hypothetical protein BDN72DRAFT_457328 [Pluteus cervinus]
MFDWDTPLTDLSSDEEEDQVDDKPLLPPPQAAPAPSQPSEEPPNGRLPAFRSRTVSVKTIFDEACDGYIDLDPPYQRDIVWTQDKQSNLIDSLIYNYSVFPLIFTMTPDSEGREFWTCIDGKQRISSIVAFMKGDVYTGKKTWFVNKDGKKNKKVILEARRKNFEKIQICFNEYDNLTMEQQRDVFQRIQNGMSLTPAERMKSLNGPVPDLVRRFLFKHEPIFGPKPGAAQFKSVAQILFMIVSSPVHYPSKRSTMSSKPIEGEVSVAQIERFLQKPPRITKVHEKILSEVMDILGILSSDSEYNAPFLTKPEPTPLDYVLAAHLIHTKRTRMSLKQLSSLFSSVRKETRKQSRGAKVSAAQHKKLMALIAEAGKDEHITPAVVEKDDYLMMKKDCRVSGIERDSAPSVDESGIPEQASKNPELPLSAGDTEDTSIPSKRPSRKVGKKRARNEDDSSDDQDNGSDYEASIRPAKSRKSQKPSPSAASAAEKAGPSKARTKVKRKTKAKTQDKTIPSAAPHNASASRASTSSIPMAETSPGTPTIPIAVPTITTPSGDSDGEGAGPQAALRRPGILKNVSVKGLTTVGTRTPGPVRASSTCSLSAHSFAMSTPASGTPSTQPTSAPLVQRSKITRDPRLQSTSSQLTGSQSQPSHQQTQQTPASTIITNPSAVSPGPSTLLSHQIHQSAVPLASPTASELLNIGSTVTVSSPTWSRPYRYQHQQ